MEERKYGFFVHSHLYVILIDLFKYEPLVILNLNAEFPFFILFAGPQFYLCSSWDAICFSYLLR
jgi:hypothetical protein